MFDPSNNLEHKIKKLKALLEKGDFKGASSISHDLEARGLEDSKALTLIAEVKVMEGDYNGAGILAKRALDSNALNVVARYVLACSLRKMSRYGEAAHIYREIIEWEPHDPVAHLYLGDVLSHEGKVDEAAKAYLKAASLDKTGDVERLATESILRLRGAK